MVGNLHGCARRCRLDSSHAVGHCSDISAPEWIRRAVLSLAAQSRSPDEVIAVARDTYTPIHESIASLQQQALPFALRRQLGQRARLHAAGGGWDGTGQPIANVGRPQATC
jgi:hypothetical protein